MSAPNPGNSETSTVFRPPDRTLYLRLLGGATLERNGEPLQGRAAHRRRLALLALLAASGRGALARERIIAYLWPDAEPDAGRRLLSEAVYIVRKELGDGALRSVGDELHLGADVVASDVGEFRTRLAASDLEGAVALYHGPFLDGWYVSDAPDFERWADEERHRLAREYADALIALAESNESAGRWTQAASRWRQLLQADAYNSRHVLRLAKALAASGERAAAIQAVQAHEQLLRTELDVPMDAELVAVVAALRDAPRPSVSVPSVPIDAPGLRDIASRGSALSDASASPPRSTRRWRLVSAVGLAALVVLVLVGAVVSRYEMRQSHDSGVEPSGLDPNRVAVLYLEDHTADHRLGPIAAEVTTDLIDALSGVNAFRVVSRNGVAQFRGTNVSVDSISKRLGAGTIVEGSVQEVDDRLQIVVQLTDARTHTVVESRRVDGPTSALFELENRVAEQVADALRQRLGQEVRLREVNAGTSDEIARKLVVLGVRERDDAAMLAAQPDTSDVSTAVGALLRADSLFARAQREDPKWLRPLLERGWTIRDLARLRRDTERVRTLRRGLEFADQALALDPSSAAAHELRGTLHWGILSALASGAADSLELQQAERDLRAAVDADSTRATAWGTLSLVVSARGAFAESQIAAERALRQDAYLDGASDIQFQLYASSVMLGDLATARSACLDGQKAYPTDWRFVECELTLLRNDVDAPPDPRRAWELVARLEVLDPPEKAKQSGHAYATIFRRMVAAAVSARAGDAAVARGEIARARRMTEGDTALRLDNAYAEAYVRLLLGDRHEAIVLLRGLIAARPVLRTRILRDRLLRSITDSLTPTG